jgi:acyl-coenzyme A synthetase/AMP-(fatty) acid ligase
LTCDADNEPVLAKELVLQVRKVIGPFAAPKKIDIVPDLPRRGRGKVSLALPSLAHSCSSVPFTFLLCIFAAVEASAC